MKILWGIDIFDNHPKAFNAAIDFLKALNIHFFINVDALYVASVDSNRENEVKKLQKKLRQQINEKLSGVKKERWFGDGHIIYNELLPQRTSVRKLTEYARINGYDAILVVKHSKAPTKRKLLGTFAEMVVFLSSVPVFLVNPDYPQPDEVENILLAVDDSPKKEREYKSLLRFLFSKGLMMELLHVVKIPLHYLLTESIREYVKDEDRYSEKTFYPLMNIGRQSGWEIDFRLKHTRKSIESVVLAEAKKNNFDMITLIHRDEGSVGFLLGRVIRKLMQETDRPLLLFRS